MTIIWSPEAADELEEAVEYVAAQNPAAAVKVASGILRIVERLASEPLDGPKAVLKTGEIVRGWPFPPFRVYYQRKAGVFFVVRVYDQRREPIEL